MDEGAVEGKGSANVTVQNTANGQPPGGGYTPGGEDHEREDSSSAAARLLQLAEETKVSKVPIARLRFRLIGSSNGMEGILEN